MCIENETLDSYQQVKQTEDDIDEDSPAYAHSSSAHDETGHRNKETCNSTV